MKDFVKWLGVNEKVAKAVVWLLIIMVTLIVFNTGLESLGFPFYKITYQNIRKINIVKHMDIIMMYIVALLNFYSIVLLVFRVKEAKGIFKYALLYLILNAILSLFFSKAVMQIFVIGFILVFCYYYSGKNWKYILYGLIGIIVNVIVQGIAYSYKVRFIDYTKLNNFTKGILSLDYFIIMIIIILVKEIYLKKRSENNGRKRRTNLPTMVGNIQQGRKLRKETSKKSSKQSKISK